MAANSLFGLEAELALSARKGETRVPVEEIAASLVNVAHRELPHLRGSGSRMFLGNGSLFYVDTGFHPEIATPECTTPWQAVAHLRSGEQMVASLAARLCKSHRLDEIFVNRCNVDYLNGTTWGCHESYLTRLPVAHYEGWLVPHLASRVYTGSGGLDPLSAGIRFSLSPRVAHIDRITSSDSTSNRGIFHTRDESLSRAYYRLHILVGDNTCSQLSHLLKIGSTALVVALAESQPQEKPLRLKNPLKAMKGFARDLGFRAEALVRGRWRMMTALEIQRHYLDRIEGVANTVPLPEWAGEFCRLWRTALEDVGRDAGCAPQGFDWPLKRHLMNREIECSGLCWETLDAWSDILENLQLRLPATGVRSGSQHLVQILPMRETRDQADNILDSAGKALKAGGLDWKDLDAIAGLRQRLCEIDVRFGLVNDGIFDTLDRRSMLAGHRVVSDAEIGRATRDAPPDTRARARGHWVKQLASEHDRYACSWEYIRGEKRYLDLGDPFASEAEWKTATENEDEDAFFEIALPLGHGVSRSRANCFGQRQMAYDLYRRGRYAEAEALLTNLLEVGFEPADTRCHLARLSLITGQSAAAREHVAQAWAARATAQAYVVARTIWLQLTLEFLDSGNTPVCDRASATPTPLLGKLKTALQSAHAVQHWGMAPVLEYLEPRLAENQHALLKALVEAMSDRSATSALERLPSWRAQPPRPLGP